MTTTTQVPNGQLYCHDDPAAPYGYELAVACGECGTRLRFRSEMTRHSPEAARRRMELRGWRWRGHDGWICPLCEEVHDAREDAWLGDWTGADEL